MRHHSRTFSKTGCYLVAVFLLGSLFFQAEGKVVRQKLKVKKETGSRKTDYGRKKDRNLVSDAQELTVRGDSITYLEIEDGATGVTFNPAEIKFAGYDKQATSRKEAFHIINNSDFSLKRADVVITYSDMKGRMLHKREQTIYCDVPPHETRLTEIPTWDSQYSFYYYLSNKPRRVASAYKVNITPKSFRISITK